MEKAEQEDRLDRLSKITTLWGIVEQAHAEAGGALASAQARLVQRYSGAVYAYLLGAVRDPEAADELFQEFALRVVRGDFFRARPERGRFRDYLRKALINLITDHHRVRQARPQQLGTDNPPAAPSVEEDERTFVSRWREELLERTWQALATAQPTYFAVLLHRVQNPDVPSVEMAEVLSARLDKPMSAVTIRKALQRGQARFADLLLAEVAISLAEPTDAELEAELRALDLLRYCGVALDRRREGS